jgi:hypothetical protein
MYNVYHKLQNMKLSTSIQNLFRINNIHNKHSVFLFEIINMSRGTNCISCRQWMKERALCSKPFVAVLRILLTWTVEIRITIDFYCISLFDKVYSTFTQICVNFRGLLKNFYRVTITFHTIVIERWSIWFAVLKKRDQLYTVQQFRTKTFSCYYILLHYEQARTNESRYRRYT